MDIEALERELKEAADDADLNGPGQMELLLSQRLGLEAAERGGGSGQTPLARYWSANVEGATIPGHDVMLFVGMDPSAGLSDPFAVVTVWKDGSIYRCLSRQFLTKKAESEASKSTRKVYADATAAGELTTHDTTEELEAAVIAYSHRLNDHPGGVTFCGDAAGLAGFKSRFEGEVASYTPVPQGWQLLQSLELAGGLAHDDNLRHTGQPLLAANIENLVLENGRMRKYDAGSNGVGHAKIDGAMALLSALLQASTGRNFDPGALIG
jgi:phage terminase large subunit-like protein